MKKTVLIFFALFSFSMLSANTSELAVFEAKESKYDTVSFKTSAVCKMCKERIEHDMSFEKGVKAVELDLPSQVVTIVYKKGKTTEKDLQVAITRIGYDADDMQADQKAHDRLPACCQKDVEPH
jgi:cation transport ATPase